MNEDSKLLEWAAKAAGYCGTRHEGKGWHYVCTYPGHKNDKSDAEWELWNPLNDDGDALRLAVKLGLSIDSDFDRIDAYRQRDLLAWEYLYQLPTPTDPYAATRRAIVRAAAAIGKEMK